jgi:hypothetical protein
LQTAGGGAISRAAGPTGALPAAPRRKPRFQENAVISGG